MSVNKKTALVTGSSRGIGKAIGYLLARNNINVVFNYNNSENEARTIIDSLKKEGITSIALKADVSDI